MPMLWVSRRSGHGELGVVSEARSGSARVACPDVEVEAGAVPSAPTYDGGVTEQRKRVLLAAPRGYCAGVDRAVVAVEKALELYGPPVYVRKQIVHNKHVVETLAARGAIFVDETDEVPEGARVVFSAHGVSLRCTPRPPAGCCRPSTPPARW